MSPGPTGLELGVGNETRAGDVITLSRFIVKNMMHKAGVKMTWRSITMATFGGSSLVLG